MGRRDYVEVFQTSAHHKGYLECLSLACDVGALHEAIIVRFEELDQADSWCYKHAHQRIHFIHFTCKTNDNILLYMIIFFIVLLYENI